MKLKTTPADAWFSKCVRMRANWTCEYCGVNLEYDRGSIDCSHFIGRSYKTVRYNPKNALAHCKDNINGCHSRLGGGRYSGGDPAEFVAHYDQIFGELDREIIRIMSKYPFMNHDQYVHSIADHYRKIYKDMEITRKGGFDGRIEFKNFSGAPQITALEKDILKRTYHNL